MSWEEFYPYQRMMVYSILRALQDYHKGDYWTVNWVHNGGLENWIDGAGLTDKLHITTLLDMTPEKIDHAIRTFTKWGEKWGV